MKKIKLQIDRLAVESFEVTAPVLESLPGTVRANASTRCALNDTCGYSCLDPGSCAGTCACTGGFCALDA